MEKWITPEQQRLVLEKLYRSDDSMTSTKKFNEQYEDQIGEMGYRSILLTDFARKMKKTHFPSLYVERYTREVTGEQIDIETI